MHKSIPLDTPCEFINVTPVNPLISKCQIKVCYVGEDPNRNGSVITKDVAKQMANSLPGSPIVGYYNEDNNDFEEHNRIIDFKDGQFRVKDGTRPYGFVDLGAKVWFQKFQDDDTNVHEYLMTEGYLWTGQYPEAQRCIDKGNNQSMELDDKLLNASWTKDDNGKKKFFIINEAIISKLCILGEDYEPCFEGSSVTNVQFSLDDKFKNELFSMMTELKELLEGGTRISMEDEKIVTEEIKETETPVEETPAAEVTDPASDTDFKKADDKKEDEEGKDGKSDDSNSEDKSEGEKSDSSEEKKEDEKSDEDEKKKKYTLEEIPEYVELSTQFSELTTKYNDLVTESEILKAQVAELTEFKKSIDRAKKEEMINKTFCMLSDEDKADVVANIDNYSLDDIEAKLSIICVRNKVSFAALEDDKDSEENPTTYNLGGNLFSDESTPAWVKAVLDTAKTLN